MTTQPQPSPPSNKQFKTLGIIIGILLSINILLGVALVISSCKHRQITEQQPSNPQQTPAATEPSQPNIVTAPEVTRFILPTPNRDLLSPNTYTNYFVPTQVGTWESGTFGCVRNDGYRIHEGIDIRSTTHDNITGESSDPVFAAADGIVRYVTRLPKDSDYGRYIALAHTVEGIEVYTLYAHLAFVPENIEIGTPVKAGEQIGILGRSTAIKGGIPKERAHLHFEIGIKIAPSNNFIDWYQKNYPKQDPRNGYHGWNLAGLDPVPILLAQQTSDSTFSLIQYIKNQHELCQVRIHKRDFPFTTLYPCIVETNPLAQNEEIVAYDVTLNFNGIPTKITPRTSSEMEKTQRKYTLQHLDKEEARKNPARRFINQGAIGKKLVNYLDQITYIP